MEISSKKHLFKYYFSLILCNIMLLGLGSFLFLKGLEQKNNKIILGSLFLLIIAISITVGFIKSAPKIIINKGGITIKNNHYQWSELTDSMLTGKGNMFITSGECTTLFFNDKICIRFYDDFYSNSAEMKYFIEQKILKKEENTEIIVPSKEIISTDNEFFYLIKGIPFFHLEEL